MSQKSSKISNVCQISNSKNLKSVIFLGYHPPVNNYESIDTPASEQKSFPCELFFCEESKG